VKQQIKEESDIIEAAQPDTNAQENEQNEQKSENSLIE